MSFWNETRLALRQLRKSPAFTLIVLATLGLCIGANTAIFSVLDAVLLRAAPYPQPDRLAMVITVVWENGHEGVNDSQTGALFEAVRDRVAGLDVAAYSGDNGANFAGQGRLEYVRQQRVSTGYFRVMGIPPQFGREFDAVEDKAGGPAVAILSYGFWQRSFRGDPAVLGSPINLRGEPYTIVGIMPRDFRSANPIDVWTPLRPSRTGEGGGSNYGVAARLRPGVSWAAASEQLRALSKGVENVNLPRGTTFEERIIPLATGMTSERRTELLITWAAVLVVLLIGCVNIAGLLLARSSAREREIATRMALGGGRPAIVRQLLVESLLLALGGCVVGVVIGGLAIDWLKRLGAADFEIWHPIVLDLRVLAAMFVISLVTSLVFGLAPALQTSRLDIRSVLVEGGRGVAGARRRWSRHALVAAEVALSLVLLVSAGLLVRTLSYLNGLTPGFDTRHVIAAEASLQDARYKTSAAVNRLFTASLERIRQIPGVQSAAAALTLPYERPLNDGFRQVESSDRSYQMTEVVYITPGYFDTLRIPVREGRAFLDSDTAATSKVMVVSQSLADKHFPGGRAIGHHLALENVNCEIVGVVGDVQQHSGLGNFGPVSIEPTIYIPVSQTADGYLQVIHTWFAPKWVIRAGGSLGTLSPQVQSAVAAIDPQLPVAGFKTMEELQGVYTRGQRYDAALFSILAGLALLLAVVGLYGLISQSIMQRTHELGVRMALGSTAPRAIATVMRPALLLVLAGVAAGFGASLVAVRFLRHLLWGVQPSDPLTFLTTAGLLLLVAVLASLLPALRLLRLDPARTLRNQ